MGDHEYKMLVLKSTFYGVKTLKLVVDGWLCNAGEVLSVKPLKIVCCIYKYKQTSFLLHKYKYVCFELNTLLKKTAKFFLQEYEIKV